MRVRHHTGHAPVASEGRAPDCCTAYLLAGPIINPVVMLSTWVAFTGHETAVDNTGKSAHLIGSLGMTSLRAGFAFLVAVLTSLIVDRLYRKHGAALLAPLAVADTAAAGTNGDQENGRKPWWKRLGNISETALHDFVDITVFLVLGASWPHLLGSCSRTNKSRLCHAIIRSCRSVL